MIRNYPVIFLSATFCFLSFATTTPGQTQQEATSSQLTATEEYAVLIKANQRLLDRIEGLSDELTVLETQFDQVRTALQNRLTVHAEERHRLQQLADAQQKDLQALQQEIAHTRSAMTEAQQQVEALEHQFQNANAAAQQWQTQHADTQRVLTEAQHKVQELMREHSKALSTMQTKREHMRQRLAAAEQQRETLEDRIIDLKQQTQDFQSSQASQKKALTNLHQKTAQLQKTLTTARQQALERQKEAQHWQTQHDSAIASLAQARKELQRVGTEANLLRQEVKVQTAQKSRGGAQSQALYDRFVKALKVIIEQQTVTVQQTPDHLMIRVGGEALFRSGQVTLRPESRQILDQIIAVLQTSPGQHVNVEGHTDNIPIRGRSLARWPTNWELSAARATAVVRYLQRQGLPSEHLTASGRAFYRPVASNDTPEGRAQNRRIELIIVPKTS